MPYDPTVFVNVPPNTIPPPGATPWNADEANKMGNAIDSLDTRVTTVEATVSTASRAFFFALINGA